MSFKIYTDIPLPTNVRSARERKYPFADMEVGDCMVIPKGDAPVKGISSVRAAVYGYRRTKDKSSRFVARTMDNGDIGIWKLA